MKVVYIVKGLNPPEIKQIPDFYFNECRLSIRPMPNLFFNFSYAMKEHLYRKTGVCRVNDTVYDTMLGLNGLGE